MKSKIARGVATVVTAIAPPIVMYVCVILIYKLYRFVAGVDRPKQSRLCSDVWDTCTRYGNSVLCSAPLYRIGY